LPRKLRSAFSDFLKRRFEATKFLLAQFMEYPFHLRGVLSKDWNNEILVACGEGDDPNGPVFGALDPAERSYMEIVRKIGFTIASIFAAISSAGMRSGV
jgi:hypothetical protein